MPIPQVPQLTGDETYKYLGTELRTGWANGEGQTEMRERCVADCKRVTWIIGNLPHFGRADQTQHGASTERHYRVLRQVYGHHMERLPEYRTSEGGRTKRKRVFGRNPTTTNI